MCVMCLCGVVLVNDGGGCWREGLSAIMIQIDLNVNPNVGSQRLSIELSAQNFSL